MQIDKQPEASQKAVVRKARQNEALLLSALAYRSKKHWGYSDAFMLAAKDELTYSPEDIANHCFCVVDTGDRVCGFYELVFIDKTLVELEAMFIEPDAIGHRYGKMLMQHAVGESRSRGAKTMRIQSDPNALGFYLHFGARQIGVQASASIPGRDLPLLELDLLELDLEVPI